MTLLFTDIHFGLKLNSEIHLKIAQDNIRWIESLVEEHKVDNIIFCGDWFHQRASVSVNTMHKSYESLKSLASKVKRFYMVVGNHDSYYKNSSSINSLKVFEQFDNIKVIDELTISQVGELECAFVPWGVSKEQIFDLKDKVDVMFGHFEPSGVRVDGGRLMEGGPYTASELIDVCHNLVSGHYHQHQTIKSDEGSLYFVGSPSQQNWGDCGQERGVMLFNEKSTSFLPKFILNEQAPKFKKFLYSDIMEKRKLPSKSEVENNFVRIIVDSSYKFDVVQNLIAKFNKANPISVEAEYFYSEKLQYKELSAVDQIKSHEDYIRDFIFGDYVDFPEDVDKEKLLGLALGIYSQAKEMDQAAE